VSSHALLSRLLDYPAELPDAENPQAASDRGVAAFLGSLAGIGLPDLQREYVETFDFDRRASLHLTFHTCGDRRQRGLELVRLKRRYAEAGFALAEGELPDYLPAVLEFAALAPEAGKTVLTGLREPIELVRTRLYERESRYASLLDAVAAGLPKLTRREADRLRRLAESEPPLELVGLEPSPVPAGLGATVP
jgi:nitrate reductase delta subunit